MNRKTKLAYIAASGWTDEMAGMDFYLQGFNQALRMAASYLSLETNINTEYILRLGEEETGQDAKAVLREMTEMRKYDTREIP